MIMARIDPYSEHGILNHIHVEAYGNLSEFVPPKEFPEDPIIHNRSSDGIDRVALKCPICRHGMPVTMKDPIGCSKNTYRSAEFVCPNCNTVVRTDPFIYPGSNGVWDITASYFVDDEKELLQFVDEKDSKKVDLYNTDHYLREIVRLVFSVLSLSCVIVLVIGIILTGSHATELTTGFYCALSMFAVCILVTALLWLDKRRYNRKHSLVFKFPDKGVK